MNDHLQSLQSLPSPWEFHQQFPVDATRSSFIHRSRQAIRDILEGKDNRLLIIVGPCSIHDITEAKEYARRLRALASQVDDRLFLVMRAYFEKPRTSTGWKGLLYDPMLDGSDDLLKGLELSRNLLLHLAAEGMPTATEFLDPLTPHYLSDLLSWSCIGARTSASQIHRQVASYLPMPVGFKNSTDGDCASAINGVLSAATSHTFLGINMHGRAAQLRSKGNPHGHVVLRGGEGSPNFDSPSVERIGQQLRALGLRQRILIDCSHDNSGKDHRRQPAIVQAIVDQITAGSATVAGLLLESYLCDGSQRVADTQQKLRYGISVTDACLDWESTAELILTTHSQLAFKRDACTAEA